MVINKNIIPVLYTVAMISGFSNLAVLANRPTPICNIERDGSGNPVRVIGTVDYSGIGNTFSFVFGIGTALGAGFLLVKQLRGEGVEEIASTSPFSLAPSSTPRVETIIENQPIAEPVMVENQIESVPMVSAINLNKQEKKPDKLSNRDIIRELATSHQSTVIVAEPGCGKSTLEKAVLATLLKTYPDVETYIIGMKNDNWLGLAKDKERFCFYQDDPSDLMEIMENVHDELLRRLGTPEDERNFEDKPFVLLLDDFPAICASLKGNPCLDRLKRILGKILTTGREVFVVAHVITQSHNVSALGLDDANIRGSMNLIALIKSNKNDSGRNDGGVGTATRMICNPTIIGDNNQKQQLLDQLPRLVKQTELTGIPGIVCIMGTSPYMGMLPDLNWVKEVKVTICEDRPQSPPVKAELPEVDTEIQVDTQQAVEMLNRAVQIDTSDYDLFCYICDLAKDGKSQTYIIEQVLKMGGRDYQQGRLRLRAMQDKYGEIPFKKN